MSTYFNDDINSSTGIALYVDVLMLPRDKISTVALVTVASLSASTMVKKSKFSTIIIGFK